MHPHETVSPDSGQRTEQQQASHYVRTLYTHTPFCAMDRVELQQGVYQHDPFIYLRFLHIPPQHACNMIEDVCEHAVLDNIVFFCASLEFFKFSSTFC